MVPARLSSRLVRALRTSSRVQRARVPSRVGEDLALIGAPAEVQQGRVAGMVAWAEQNLSFGFMCPDPGQQPNVLRAEHQVLVDPHTWDTRPAPGADDIEDVRAAHVMAALSQPSNPAGIPLLSCEHVGARFDQWLPFTSPAMPTGPRLAAVTDPNERLAALVRVARAVQYADAGIPARRWRIYLPYSIRPRTVRSWEMDTGVLGFYARRNFQKAIRIAYKQAKGAPELGPGWAKAIREGRALTAWTVTGFERRVVDEMEKALQAPQWRAAWDPAAAKRR